MAHRLIIIIAFMALCATDMLARENPLSQPGRATQPDALVFGFDKIINRYYFTGNLNYHEDFGWGIVSIDQKYLGTVLPLVNTVVRDEETFRFDLEIPYNKWLSIIVNQNWILSTDSRSIGINDLERINGLGGLRLLTSENSFVEAMAGGERNSQVGVAAPGSIFRLAGGLADADLDGYKLNSGLQTQLLDLDDGRSNSDLLISADVSRDYDMLNAIDIGANYKLMNRDYLTPLTLIEGETNAVESRLENRLAASMNLDYAVSERIAATARLIYNDLRVEKSYKNYFEELSVTGIGRQHQELNLTIDTRARYISDDFIQEAGIYFESRDEDNTIENKYGIMPTEEDRLRRIENQRDVSSSRTRVIARSMWTPTQRDTFGLDYSASILRYDTPSDLNNSDRDEFSTIFGLRYGHRFSPIVSASVSAELQMLHLVYLKKEMSGNNNWNRIIRFTPSVSIRTESFAMSPKFEVMANYTVFDYQSVNAGVKNLSFRQIRYQDSLIVILQKNLSLQSRINFRYYESGILYWENFSEIPLNSSLEQLVKLFAIVKMDEKTEIGCGVRYYRILQRNLSRNPSNAAVGGVNIYSVGPETMISARVSDNLKISISGWYEFQTVNKYDKREIPNLFLQTYLTL